MAKSMNIGVNGGKSKWIQVYTDENYIQTCKWEVKQNKMHAFGTLIYIKCIQSAGNHKTSV